MNCCAISDTVNLQFPVLLLYNSVKNLIQMLFLLYLTYSLNTLTKINCIRVTDCLPLMARIFKFQRIQKKKTHISQVSTVMRRIVCCISTQFTTYCSTLMSMWIYVVVEIGMNKGRW